MVSVVSGSQKLVSGLLSQGAGRDDGLAGGPCLWSAAFHPAGMYVVSCNTTSAPI